MSQPNSYRTILRSSSIIGSASVVNILIGLIRNKAIAVLLGPAGVGLIGLLSNLMQTATTFAALGLGPAATRQIAEAAANGNERDIARVRQAVFWGTVGLAVIGCATFFLLRNVIATRLLGELLHATTIGWLSIGVFLSVASGSQQALLNGLRRIGDLARLQIASAVLSAFLGLCALVALREKGVALFILASPLATFVMGHRYVRRLGSPAKQDLSLNSLVGEWRTLIQLGFAFMVTALVHSSGNLLVRSVVQQELGAAALGHFQAAWTISMTYIGFVLGAMTADYYPRLTGVIDQHESAARMVNEQTEVALMLAGPVLTAMLALAPWVIRILYTSEFAPAAQILRWQVLGDILKVASWPLGFILVAAGSARTYVVTETLAEAVFVLGTVMGLPIFGSMATGQSFALMYAVYLPIVLWLAHRRIGMVWTAAVWRHLGLLLSLAIVIMLLGQWSDIAAAVVGIFAATMLGLLGLRQLSAMGELAGPVARLSAIARRLMRRRGA